MTRLDSKAKVDATELEGLDQLLGRIPALIVATGGPLDRAVSKAGTVVAKRARQLAPDSKKTGSRNKQSEGTKKKWPNRLRTTIRTKVSRYEGVAVAIVGPKNPEGNAAHFMQEKPRKLVLWGRSTMIKPFRIARDWIVQAFDETKSDQEAAMRASLTEDIDKVMRG